MPVDLSTDPILSYHITFDVNTSAVTKVMVKIQNYPSGCSWYSLANVDLTTYASTAPHPPTHNSTCGDYYDRSGNDGKFYRLNNTVAWPVKISRYNNSTNDYTTILGTGQGYCADGTLATSCKINITDIYVTPDGKVFVLENGLIRVIDETGKVQTVYGQTKTYGDGGLAQDARFNNLYYINHGVGENVIVYDQNEKVMREIVPTHPTSQVNLIAGNGESASVSYGTPAYGQSINGSSWDQPGAFVTNSVTGDVYFPCNWGIVCKLNRSTGFWEKFSGGGSTNGTSTGDIDGTIIKYGGYNVGILSYYSGKLITGQYEWSGTTSMNSIFRELDTGTNISSFMAGKVENVGASGCPDGAGNGCNLGFSRGNGKAYTYHTGLGAWLFRHHGNDLKLLKTDPGTGTGNISLFKTMPEGIRSMVWNGTTLYYCTDGGHLKKMDFPSEAVTSLPWPVNSMSCSGASLLFKPASGSKPDRLVFPFTQNGLSAVGEYFLN